MKNKRLYIFFTYLAYVYYKTIYNFDKSLVECFIQQVIQPVEHPLYQLLKEDQTENYNQTYTSEPFLFVQGATKITSPNHTDPYYSDVCYTITREMCDMCCLIDFEFCSRDIGICNPVSDRNLGTIVDCVKILGGILLGIPLLSFCCKCFLSYRFCSRWFENVGGVSCFECLMRCLCIIFCIKFGEVKQKQEEII